MYTFLLIGQMSVMNKQTPSLSIKYFLTFGGHQLPVAIMIFNSKVISQLLYGFPVWIKACHEALDYIVIFPLKDY